MLIRCNFCLVQKEKMALVVHQDHLYYTRNEPFPVGTLIERIWSQFPDQARSISRKRIFTSSPLTPLCEGMLKVAGKRATQLITDEYLKIFNSLSETNKTILISKTNEHYIEFPFSTVQEFYSKDDGLKLAESLADLSKNKIGAILLDPNGSLISWGWNQHHHNKTLHAEVMLVKNYVAKYNKKIPMGCTLISTLQPCAMCAGYIYGHSEDFSSIKIIYSQPDLGPKAQNSILVPGSQLWKNAFSY